MIDKKKQKIRVSPADIPKVDPLPLEGTPRVVKVRRTKEATPSGDRWLLIGVCTFLLSFLTVLVLWFKVPATRNLIGQGGPLPTAQGPTPAPTPTPEPGYTIALMGRGGAGHDGGALTDTILIARLLDTQKKAVLISIPRDLWVQIPYDGSAGTKSKINAAYAIGIDSKNYKGKLEKYTGTTGGGALSKDVLESVTGLTIDKYITIDFSGFEQAIDNIGGIDLSVERAFVDYEYPIAGREDWDCAVQPTAKLDDKGQLAPDQSPMPNAISEADLIAAGKLDGNILPDLPKQYPCRYELLDIAAGSQHMDGKRALKYVRSRHSAQDGNDFARSKRQRLVLEAVMEKLFSLNAFAKIPTFLSTLRSHVDTDFSTADILGLIPKASTVRTYPITNLALSTDNYLTQGYTADRQFALTPITGEGNYTAVKDWVATAIIPDRKLKYPTIEVTSFWKNSTASATLVNQLIAAGYPAKVGTLVMKNATTSATLIYSNSSIDPMALKTIQTSSQVLDSYLQFASPSAKFQPRSDITILLP